MTSLFQPKTAQEDKEEEEEQRELVAFLFQPSSPSIQEAGPNQLDLGVLGASLPLWAPHATAAHLDAFWEALLRASLTPIDATSTEKDSGVVESDASPPVMRILADANFYEVGPLAERCLPCCLRMQLAALVGEGVVLPSFDGAGVEEAVAAAAADLLVCAGKGKGKGKEKAGKGKREGKGKKGSAAAATSSPLAAALLHAIDYSGPDPAAPAAMAQAAHWARLLNSLPRGYLPAHHAPLRFAGAALLDAAVTRLSPQQQGQKRQAFALRLALTLSATQALRTTKGGAGPIVGLVAGQPALLQWVAARALPMLVTGEKGVKQEMGLDLLGAYLRRVLEGGEAAAAEGMAALLQALEEREGGGLVGRLGAAEDEGEEEAAQALAVVAELVAPFCIAPQAGGPGATAPLLALIDEKLAPHLARRFCRLSDTSGSLLRPALLRLYALLLELLGPRQHNEEKHAQQLQRLPPPNALALVLSPPLLTVEKGAANSNNKEETLAFLAAYLRWAPREEGEEDEGAVLGVMVDEVLRPSHDMDTAAAGAMAAALARAGVVAQRRGLARLEAAFVGVTASLASAVGGSAGAGAIVVERGAGVLGRVCRLMALLVEQGGAGQGPGAMAVAAVAPRVLSLAVRALAALEAAMLQHLLPTPPSSSSTKVCGSAVAAGLRAVVEGLNLLRLYTRKRWLLFAPLPSLEGEALEAAGGKGEGEEEEKEVEPMEVEEAEVEDDEEERVPVVTPITSSTGEKARVRGGMQVEDVGRLLAPLAPLPTLLLAALDRRGQGRRAEEERTRDGHGQTLEEAVVGAACSLLSALLKHQPRLVYQGAPPVIQAARRLFRVLLHRNTLDAAAGGGRRLGPVAAKAWARLMEHMAGALGVVFFLLLQTWIHYY